MNAKLDDARYNKHLGVAGGDAGVRGTPSGVGDVSEIQVTDPTNPAHYSAFTIEPIDAIESWGLGYNLASVVAYIVRAGRKPAVRDGRGLNKSSAASDIQRSGDQRTPEPDGQAEGVCEGERGPGTGRVHSGDALTAGRRSDLRKALRYLVREITGLDGHPSWNPADVDWTAHLSRNGEA